MSNAVRQKYQDVPLHPAGFLQYANHRAFLSVLTHNPVHGGNYVKSTEPPREHMTNCTRSKSHTSSFYYRRHPKSPRWRGGLMARVQRATKDAVWHPPGLTNLTYLLYFSVFSYCFCDFCCSATCIIYCTSVHPGRGILLCGSHCGFLQFFLGRRFLGSFSSLFPKPHRRGGNRRYVCKAPLGKLWSLRFKL